MGYTQFYREVQETPDKITWKDIFSEFRQKHTKEDMEYAFLAGTAVDSASEEDMLHKWKKPWLFWRVFLILLAAAGANLLLMELGKFLTNSVNAGTVMISQLLLPMIVPVVLMIFFWELNIPRNISLFELLGCFVVGGMLSFFVTNLLSVAIAYDLPAFIGGPFREEPAKLAASLLLLYFYGKRGNKKIYGLTGLVVGAAVGTGFSAFESIVYVLSNEWTQTAVVRMIGAFVGHTVYTAPYMAAIAFHMENGSLRKETFLNRDFAVTFLGAVGAHMLWNSNIVAIVLIMLGVYPNVTLYVGVNALVAGPVVWGLTLFMTRKCMQQAVRAGRYRPGGASTMPARSVPPVLVQCISGADHGLCWHSGKEKNAVTIGCSPECQMVLQRAPGVSRSHCSIRFTHQGWTVTDLNSSYGTYLENGKRLVPGAEHRLRNGEVLYLGSRNTAIRIMTDSGL